MAPDVVLNVAGVNTNEKPSRVLGVSPKPE